MTIYRTQQSGISKWFSSLFAPSKTSSSEPAPSKASLMERLESEALSAGQILTHHMKAVKGKDYPNIRPASPTGLLRAVEGFEQVRNDLVDKFSHYGYNLSVDDKLVFSVIDGYCNEARQVAEEMQNSKRNLPGDKVHGHKSSIMTSSRSAAQDGPSTSQLEERSNVPDFHKRQESNPISKETNTNTVAELGPPPAYQEYDPAGSNASDSRGHG